MDSLAIETMGKSPDGSQVVLLRLPNMDGIYALVTVSNLGFVQDVPLYEYVWSFDRTRYKSILPKGYIYTPKLKYNPPLVHVKTLPMLIGLVRGDNKLAIFKHEWCCLAVVVDESGHVSIYNHKPGENDLAQLAESLGYHRVYDYRWEDEGYREESKLKKPRP